MAREFFCCYHSYKKKCEKLSDQELGRLFRALMDFSETGERADLAGREAIAFDFIADDIARAEATYAEKCRKNAASGAVGARRRWHSENSGRQKPHSENSQEKNENENEKEKEKEKNNIMMLTHHVSARTDYMEAVNAYNELCAPTLPAVKQVSETRKGHIKTGLTQLKKADVTWREYFSLAATSDFLMGRNGAWHGCGFDWLIKPANMLKVLEGNYKNRLTPEQEAEQQRQAELDAWKRGEIE